MIISQTELEFSDFKYTKIYFYKYVAVFFLVASYYYEFFTKTNDM